MYGQCIYDNGNPYEDNPCYNCGECRNQCIYDNGNPYESNPCYNCGECRNQCIYSTNPYENDPCRDCGSCKEDDYKPIGSYNITGGGTSMANIGSTSVKMDSQTKYKLQSLATIKDKSEKELVAEFVEEKIMNLDVVKFAEKLSDPKSNNKLPSSYRDSVYIGEKSLSSDASKRLTILAGVCREPENSYSTFDPIEFIVSKLFNEKIDEIDLIELIKEEYEN